MAGIKSINYTPNNQVYNVINFLISCYSTFIKSHRNIGYYSNNTALVALAFAGSIGMTFVILACALPQYKLWWPFFVVLFYVLAPLPTLFARRYTDSSGPPSVMEAAIFITMFIVISSFALPIVLARAPVASPTIHWGACYLTLAGNVFIYITMIIFFMTIDSEDGDYSAW